MRSTEEGSWSRLPDEISDRVLSLLRVPALCRCRCVCKKWRELLRKPSFLDLCDLNWKDKPYIFVTCHWIGHGWSTVEESYRLTTCFLDLDERRWYSIPADVSLLAPTAHNVPRLLAMDDGLICELSAIYEEYNMIMFDPVAKSKHELPPSTYDDGPVFCLVMDPLSEIVTAVDNAQRGFKVFVMSRVVRGPHTGFFVYESSTHVWRALPNPPYRLGDRLGLTIAYSLDDGGRAIRRAVGPAIFFQGNLYAIFFHDSSSTVLLLSDNLEENLWREVVGFVATKPGYPQLIVIGDSMFVSMWFDAPHIPLSSEEGSSSGNHFVFEIKEILVDENSSRLVVRISNADLQEIFGEESDFDEFQYNVAYGFPLSFDSVVLFSRRTGRLITYDVRSGAVEELPPHPLKETSSELGEQAQTEGEELEDELPPLFHAKLMNLNLRNILS